MNTLNSCDKMMTTHKDSFLLALALHIDDLDLSVHTATCVSIADELPIIIVSTMAFMKSLISGLSDTKQSPTSI